MLQSLLTENSNSGIYPFHMPGHKRNTDIMQMMNPYALDITEVPGFDDLHAADGILLSSMQKAAALFGSRRAFFLVGGSSCGLIAGIFALANEGETVIAARNCHKSVYNGLMLRGCKTAYINPEISENGFCLGVTPAEAEKAFCENPDAKLMIITSPTYEGIVSDIRGIAEACHKRGAALLVDEAHGAHLGFSDKFPESAVSCGADIVVQSVHKTLPAFTQTALLHLCTERAEKSKIAEWLTVFQSSSPSYILMAGIDSCCDLLKNRGDELFAEYTERLDKFYKEAEGLKNIKIYGGEEGSFARDIGKLVIISGRAGISGGEIAEILLKKYKLQLEMSAAGYALAMTSVCDTNEGFERLLSALIEIDKEAKGAPIEVSPQITPCKAAMTLKEGAKLSGEALRFEKCAGKISAEFVYAYPPGIPLIAPGEIISGEAVEAILSSEKAGVKIKTPSNPEGGEIRCV